MRWSWVALAGLSGCADTGGVEARPSGAAPPPALSLRLAPPVAGEVWTATAVGATPGASVSLVLGEAVGAGACLPALGGGCLGVTGAARRIGVARADAGGVARWSLPLPAAAPWGGVALEAIQLSGLLRSDANEAWVQTPGRTERGVWFWTAPGDPYGAAAIVGDAAAEAAMVADLDRWSVRRVYGSYDWSGAPDARIAAFHQRLGADRTVELLLGENSWLLPATWPGLDAILQRRIADFHAATPPDAWFDGVHLDIEPHALADWSALPPSDKRRRLAELAAAYAHVRDWLDTHGFSALTLRSDIATWYDNLPPALGGTGSVGWTSVADRDYYFQDLCDVLDGVTLMTYERDSVASIQSGAAWERANMPCEVRASVDTWVGPGATWPDVEQMITVASGVEDAWGTGEGLDLHHWASFRGELP